MKTQEESLEQQLLNDEEFWRNAPKYLSSCIVDENIVRAYNLDENEIRQCYDRRKTNGETIDGADILCEILMGKGYMDKDGVFL